MPSTRPVVCKVGLCVPPTPWDRELYVSCGTWSVCARTHARMISCDAMSQIWPDPRRLINDSHLLIWETAGWRNWLKVAWKPADVKLKHSRLPDAAHIARPCCQVRGYGNSFSSLVTVDREMHRNRTLSSRHSVSCRWPKRAAFKPGSGLAVSLPRNTTAHAIYACSCSHATHKPRPDARLLLERRRLARPLVVHPSRCLGALCRRLGHIRVEHLGSAIAAVLGSLAPHD